VSNNRTNPWEKENTNESIVLNNSINNKSLNDIDFRRLISVWPYALAFCILGIIAGKIYTRYIVTTYSVTTKINIQQKEEITLQQAVSGTSRDPFNDRIAYLKSPALAIKVVKEMNLQYNATLKGSFKDKSLYNFIDWKIVNSNIKPTSIPYNFSFTITPVNKKLYLQYKNKKNQEIKFNSTIMLDTFLVKIDSLKPFDYNSPIVCTYLDEWNIAGDICSRLSIKADKESNIIDITFNDISTERAKEILTGIVITYNNILSNDKSLGFSQAIDFINKRIEPLGNELDSIENNLANYQSSRGFVSENSNGKLYLDKIQEIDKKLIEVEIQEANINAIEKFINDKSNKDVSYNVIGISDLNLQNNISLLQQLKLEKDKLSNVLTPNNPNIKIVENNIVEAKKNIEQQLSSYKKTINVSKKFCENRINEANSLIRNTPKDEKGLIDITRLRNIKEALFLALLQKREEAAIAKASTTVDTKILNPPTIVPSQQKPSNSIIIILTGFLGLLIPVIFCLVKELLNNKIISKKQLENYLNIPILAELEFVEKRNRTFAKLLDQKDRSMFSEQLRSLRTQLDFYKKEEKCLTILVTSNMSGEGKSFISLNLAKTFALQNKKVALLELDLRRPKISKEINIEKPSGITNFLLGNANLEDIIIKPLQKNHNLDFFASGPIPPNPQELLTREKLETLQDFLQKNYDVVILDTPPFGIVSDAQILSGIADTTLVITRFNYTFKEQIVEINKWHESKYFPSLAIVFNGIKNKGYYGNKYGYYYYKRKYGYDYYTAER
jgi:tyrosine-protein kinase Etk/Wzc